MTVVFMMPKMPTFQARAKLDAPSIIAVVSFSLALGASSPPLGVSIEDMHLATPPSTVEIMVKTRGLGRALGKVIGKALGRQDHHDSDDGPQRRRPTTSARRQQEVASVAEDEPVVAEDVHAHGAEAGLDAKGFLGGSRDPSVLTEYGDHVAVIVWNGEERPELKLSSHGRKVQKLGRPAPEIEGLVVVTRLSPLITCSVDTGDRELIFAFVERWHKETSSFHLLVGELTSPWMMWHTFHTFEPLHVDEVVLMLVELLEVSSEEARAETIQCHGAYSGSYAWGAAALVHMYDHLNYACKSEGRQLAGYITLLQIYEHFPSVVECLTDPDYDDISQRACRKRSVVRKFGSLLDGCWMPYDEHRGVREFDLISCFSGHLRWGPVVVRHRLERVMQQFRYVQTIPIEATGFRLSFEEIDDKWMHYSDYLAVTGQICVVPGQCASDYMDWFFMISHPFMTPEQPANPARHPPVTQHDTYVEPHILRSQWHQQHRHMPLLMWSNLDIGFPSNRGKVEASAQPKDSHDRHKNTQGHGRLHQDR
ncbi:Protein MAIN-LIKE 1 [Glycine max]|nr:Protein MAIN-LIKE 1 [Glycine max]